MPRPTKYTPDKQAIAGRYVQDSIDNNTTPFIEELALKLDIHRDTIQEWSREHDEFSVTLERLKNVQRLRLQQRSLEKEYQSNVAIFLLKANHGFDKDNTEALAGGYSLRVLWEGAQRLRDAEEDDNIIDV